MSIKYKAKITLIIIFLFYCFTVIWFTVLKRTAGISIIHDDLFWSYQEWFKGNWQVGRQVIGNIAMFVPFGFQASALLNQKKDQGAGFVWKQILIIIICAFAFSFLIETLQLIRMKGTCELDDLFSNTLGALIGILLYKKIKEQERLIKFFLVLIAAACAGVIIAGGNLAQDEREALPRVFCFQAETAENRDGALTLTGVAFRYNHPEWMGTIVLQSTETGEQTTLATEQTERPEVNKYFLCKTDYTRSGFRASGEADPEEEYEIMIRFPLSGLLATGSYITGERIHYVPDKEFREPEAAGTELEEIIRNGTLRVFRPDYHCWVYQKDNCLYWIAEPGFTFEKDGTTLVQYHLWTTQKGQLPEKRLKNNWFWDNIGGYFEQYELEGNFGQYRVSCREIPREYSITSILTGYYKNKKWIWSEYFRPV